MKHRYRSRRHRKPKIINRTTWSTNDGRQWWCHPTRGWRSTKIKA